MQKSIIFGFLLVAVLGDSARGQTLSPAAQAAIAPVVDGIDRALEKNAALPPARSDQERIIRLGDLDQAGRRYIGEVDFSKLTLAEATAAKAAMSAKMETLDAQLLAQLVAMLPPEGWFGIAAYGEHASDAAFHIVNHGDQALMKRLLPTLEAFALRGDAQPEEFMSMYDRVAVADGRPQRYGTQVHCVGTTWTPYPIEDADHIEDRLAAMKSRETYAQSQARLKVIFGDRPCF